MPAWIMVALRTLASIVVLFFLTKLLGKRQVSQLSFFEYITGITIGSIAAYASAEAGYEWYLGLISMAVWAVVVLLVEILQVRSKKLRDLTDGKATVLVKNGKLLEDNLKKERVTIDELLEQFRKKNIFSLADVEFAVMEPSGEVSILPKKENMPITPKMLGIKVAEEQEPQTVIIDGRILDEPLANAGQNRNWIYTELEKLGVALENVSVGQVDSYGQLTVDLYDDQLEIPEPQERAVLLTTLKKCQADLELFALSTQNTTSKQMYEECAKQLQETIKETKPYLLG